MNKLLLVFGFVCGAAVVSSIRTKPLVRRISDLERTLLPPRMNDPLTRIREAGL